MFYNQPLAVRFGTELKRHLDQVDQIAPYWDSLDIAVAWVRSSGMAHLSESLINFLRNGGRLSVVVGIDIYNTTKEGLQALLDLEQHGHCETHVYHNEAGGVFHPKLYLFRNEEEARLIVGSNNLTESGLYVNVEAGLQVDTQADAEVITQALDALASWKDTTSRLAIKLDLNFLEQLVAGGYVPDEAAARAKISRDIARQQNREETPELFGRRRVVAPERRTTGLRRTAAQPAAAPTATPTPATTPPVVVPSGTALLMRLRKAHTSRPTQTQIPFRVVDTFFKTATEVRSAHSGERHPIVQAGARGTRNTVKLEIPEMRDFNQPMARFEKTADGIVYEAYDLGTPQGNQILTALEEGRRDNSTQLSISTADRATWWRFI